MCRDSIKEHRLVRVSKKDHFQQGLYFPIRGRRAGRRLPPGPACAAGLADQFAQQPEVTLVTIRPGGLVGQIRAALVFAKHRPG